MARYAVIISVEEYSHFPPTLFTHADSRLIYTTLTEQCDYAVQHTLILNLSPENEKRPAEIIDEIRQVMQKSSGGDTLLFYFAGHGHSLNGKTYLVLPTTNPGSFETTALPLEDISIRVTQLGVSV